MNITYRDDLIPETEQIIELYTQAGLPRPVQDPERMKLMFENSDLVITAWEGERLAGICRCITDWVWSCYLADLAISPDAQKSGIGKKLIDLTREKVGEKCSILLLSVPTAFEYYPRVGFKKETRGFSIERVK